jgi:hypothetical protein
MSDRIPRAAVLAALALLVPLGLHAQGGGGGMGGQGGGQMMEQLLTSPAAFALEHRAALEITAEQAPRLEAMAEAYDEKNAEHLALLRDRAEQMARMRAEGGQGAGQRGQGAGRQGQRGQMQGAMAEMQGAMQALRSARQAQLDAMGDVLTANQLRELRQRMAPRVPGADGTRALRAGPGLRGAPVALVVVGNARVMPARAWSRVRMERIRR